MRGVTVITRTLTVGLRLRWMVETSLSAATEANASGRRAAHTVSHPVRRVGQQ